MSGGTDWAVGDLALCVDASPPELPVGPVAGKLVHQLVEGAAYKVLAVRMSWSKKHAPVPCLVLDGFDYRTPKGGEVAGFVMKRFRKIRPDTHEPCEEEFAELLKRKSAPVVSRKSSPVDGETVGG